MRGPEAWLAMAKAVSDHLTVLRPCLDLLVLERQQVYLRGHGNPDDLLELAGVNGAIVAKLDLPKSHAYLPREWKSNIPKSIMLNRIESRLSAEELATIQPCPASLRNNIIDSVGLGLKHVKRL